MMKYFEVVSSKRYCIQLSELIFLFFFTSAQFYQLITFFTFFTFYPSLIDKY